MSFYTIIVSKLTIMKQYIEGSHSKKLQHLSFKKLKD